MKSSVSLSAKRRHGREAIRRNGCGCDGRVGKPGATRHLPSFIALALVLVPTLGIAKEASGTLQISLTVVASCSVSTQPLAFATYAADGPAVGVATPGVIDVTCTRGVPAAVYLDGDRTLAGPAGARVAYTVRANGQAWPAGTSIAVSGQGSQPVRLQLTGSVPGGQNVTLGGYADAAVVRVVY